MSGGRPIPSARAHLAMLLGALSAFDDQVDRLDDWGRALAQVLLRGGRLLTAGNGGSASLAQHLAGELVGRYRDDRPPLSALALCAETSAVTAIANDYGAAETFARQVRAHGRPGDVLLAISTSGRSENVLAAAAAAAEGGLVTWALAGRSGSPLTELCDEAVCVDADATATIQEVHQVAVHILCAAVDVELGVCERSPVREEVL